MNEQNVSKKYKLSGLNRTTIQAANHTLAQCTEHRPQTKGRHTRK